MDSTNECAYCKSISEAILQELPIDNYTINGWQAARHVHALAFVTDPEQVEAFNRLTTYELYEGRWCKGCYKKI